MVTKHSRGRSNRKCEGGGEQLIQKKVEEEGGLNLADPEDTCS